ncbi:MAG TPA: tetratricopeptide repeat protein [Kofleriaceae bacterium]|nr:tetratricopeptide repeat protein [Kofleriaceae bacterium]
MSPKNRGKFGKAKATAIPETDEFISGVDRVMRVLRPHALRLAVFFGIIAVIVVSYTTWKWYQQRQLTDATEIYMRAVSLSQVPVRAAETEQPDAAQQKAEKRRSKLPPDPRGYPDEFPTAADRSRSVLSALEELSSEYGSTEVARQGLLLQAEALYQLGRHDDSAARYREYADGGGPSELVLSAREGLAYSLEAKATAQKDTKARQAGLEQALKAFQEMQPDPKGPRRDEALYHQARVMAELGRKEQARKTLEQLLADHPESTLKADIEMRLPDLRTAAK